MVNSELTSYIRSSLLAGYPWQRIQEVLVGAGWSQSEVADAFLELDRSGFGKQTESANTQDKRRFAVFKMWAMPAVFSLGVFVLFNIYLYFYLGGFELLGIISSLAGTAAVDIGTSFALSGFSYYFDFLDGKLAYRKNFGLLGYFLALTYSISLLYYDPDTYYYGFSQNLLTPDFLFGLFAMTILTVMALVSNNWAIKKLGPKIWKYILRSGYLAYFLLILRAYSLERESWFLWLSNFEGLPPPRLLVSVFAFLVILLRIAMEISIHFRKKEK